MESKNRDLMVGTEKAQQLFAKNADSDHDQCAEHGTRDKCHTEIRLRGILFASSPGVSVKGCSADPRQQTRTESYFPDRVDHSESRVSERTVVSPDHYAVYDAVYRG